MRLNTDMLSAAAAQIAEALRIADARADFKNVELRMLEPSHYALHLLAMNFNLNRLHVVLTNLNSGEPIMVNTEANDEWPNYVTVSLVGIPAISLVGMVTFS